MEFEYLDKNNPDMTSTIEEKTIISGFLPRNL
jgi:hypothetical protein